MVKAKVSALNHCKESKRRPMMLIDNLIYGTLGESKTQGQSKIFYF